MKAQMKRIARPLAIASAVFFLTASAPARYPAGDARVERLVQALTLEEKVDLLGGTGFDTKPIPRLGIPSIKMTDGPLGVRWGRNTAFPSGISMGATFDPELIQTVAAAMGRETLSAGRNMLLGPCVNISRQPFGGRNFESFGEDPYLSSRLAEAYVIGLQGENVLGSVKHFAVNDQEVERMTIDVRVSPRALFEVHFPAFQAAVDAGVWSVMASYNKVNGHWATENDYLQNQVLKSRWGFRGFIVSDWGATHSTAKAANAGLDLEMPTGDFFGPKLLQAVRNGEVAEKLIDDKVRRILRAMEATGILDGKTGRAEGPESLAHQALALRAAQESLVLLKNEDNALPIREGQTIAIVGPMGDRLRTGGGGSSRVEPHNEHSLLKNFRERAKGHRLDYSPGIFLNGELPAVPTESVKPSLNSKSKGWQAEYFDNFDFRGEPFLTRLENDAAFPRLEDRDPRLKQNVAVRWQGYVHFPEAGTYRLSTMSDDGIRLYVNGKKLYENWEPHGAQADEANLTVEKAGWQHVRLDYYQGEGGAILSFGWELPNQRARQEALELARRADIAVVFGGLGEDEESEGHDRLHMDLPSGQAEFIREVARANPNTVVVLQGGNPLAMGTWVHEVKAVVQAWYPGQEGGYAMADLLLGNINPSGKLPVSFLKRWEDSPAYGNYPGNYGTVHYEEGIFVGYRHFDRPGSPAPEFPFGHGLSYTSFAYENLRVEVKDRRAANPEVLVHFTLRNTGSRTGAEVAQAYVGELSPSLPRPVRELKGFRKVELKPGEARHITLSLDRSAFAYFDEEPMAWRVNPGQFRLEVGSSSRDIRLQREIKLR